MSTLIQRMQTRYLHNHDFLAALGRESTCALSDFLGNQQVMSAFWHRFYPGDLPRQVICGLNPGQLGAGLTGVPVLLERLGFYPDVSGQPDGDFCLIAWRAA